MRVLAIAAILALAAQVKLAGPAGAYATQVSSEPSDGAVVPAAPPPSHPNVQRTGISAGASARGTGRHIHRAGGDV